MLAVNVLPMCSLTWLDRYNDQQKDRRELALAEVSEAKSKLEATLAENAGLHQHLLTQAREAGILDERQRMAREIHDTLAQGLTGIVTQLQAAEHAADDPAGWRRHFAAATRLARESLTEARRSVNALRPEPLETARLSDALTSVAGRWSTLHGVPVQVALDVRDDGRGFDPAEANGFGLVAMRQRIEALSGTLQVESEPGTGTAISASLPAEAAGTPEAAGAQAPETAQAPQRPKGQAHEPLRRRPHQAADRGRSPGGQGRAEQHVRA